MKANFIVGAFAVVVLVAGCGRAENASDALSGPTNSPANTAPTNRAGIVGATAPITVSTPVMQPILTAWQEGKPAAAIDEFAGANWNTRPLFPAAMAVGMTDSQFKALSGSELARQNNEMLAQLELLKQIVTAVNDAGQDAIAKGDPVRARKIFTALRQCGAALDDPAAQLLVKQVGQVCKGMGARGLAKLAQ